MSEPTTTRKVLRREIALAERMQFYLRYPDNEVSLTGVPTTTSLAANALTQEDDRWNNGWCFIASGAQIGQERRILNFTASNDTLSLEYALPGAPAAGDKIEILDVFNAAKVHQAINRAIEMASRIYVDTAVDTSMILCENKLRYTLSNLTKRPFRLQRLMVERVNNSQVGTVSSVSVSGADHWIYCPTLFKTNDQYNGQKISFYSGTGAGSIGTIDDTVGATGYVVVTSADLTTPPATGSKFRIWDENYQTIDLYELRNLRTDAAEFPDLMYLEGNFSDFYGCRMHLFYMTLPAALTTDTDTTIVPKEYITRKARAFLHEDLLSDNRADAQRHSNVAQYFHAQAEEYIQKYPPKRSSDAIWVQSNLGTSHEISDPLGWRGD